MGDDRASVVLTPGSGVSERPLYGPARSTWSVAPCGANPPTRDEGEGREPGPVGESDGDVGVDDEMIVEEISIDGLCGVY